MAVLLVGTHKIELYIRYRHYSRNIWLQELDTSILDSLNGSEGSIGIMNVHRRIQLYYGEDHGVAIVSHPGGGNLVTITLPLERNDPND